MEDQLRAVNEAVAAGGLPWLQKTDIRPAGIESITPNDGWQEIFCRRLHTAMSEAADYH